MLLFGFDCSINFWALAHNHLYNIVHLITALLVSYSFLHCSLFSSLGVFLSKPAFVNFTCFCLVEQTARSDYI